MTPLEHILNKAKSKGLSIVMTMNGSYALISKYGYVFIKKGSLYQLNLHLMKHYKV